MNIVLTGFMGTGKSEVGKLLAEKLGWQFFDTDALIEDEVGMSVAEIFARQGEPFFRKLESKTVMLLGLLDRSVIACGGGVVLRSENMDELERNGMVVCLTAAPETILERTKNDRSRPLLKTADPLDTIKGMLAAREACYRRAHLTVATDHKNVEDIVREILENPSVVSRLKK